MSLGINFTLDEAKMYLELIMDVPLEKLDEFILMGATDINGNFTYDNVKYIFDQLNSLTAVDNLREYNMLMNNCKYHSKIRLMFNNLVKITDEQIMCDICCETGCKVVLVCLHELCLSCYTEIVKTHKCPFCRKYTT